MGLISEAQLRETLRSTQAMVDLICSGGFRPAELAERRKKLFGDAPREVERSMLFDVEAPEYYRTRAFMSVQEALELALDAETKACVYRYAVGEELVVAVFGKPEPFEDVNGSDGIDDDPFVQYRGPDDPAIRYR